MAKFKKDNKMGKGRPKGSTNLVTSKMKELFAKALEDDTYPILDDINSLSPKDRLKVKLEIAKFIIPTLKSVDATIESDQPMNILNLGDGVPIDLEEIRNIVKEVNEEY
jgi:hypothetical protein